VDLAQFSATALPFATASFDFVLFLEATYYVRAFDEALDEIDRILSADGIMLFVNANPERPDFIRSPFSEHYHTATEFRRLLEARGFEVETSAGFVLNEQAEKGLVAKTASMILPRARQIAEALRLIPRTLKGRARIKRLIFGKLLTLPRELPPDFAPTESRKTVGGAPVRDHKVIYVVARRARVASSRGRPALAVVGND
jgi:SAM-dependent methyltransferase